MNVSGSPHVLILSFQIFKYRDHNTNIISLQRVFFYQHKIYVNHLIDFNYFFKLREKDDRMSHIIACNCLRHYVQ